jgi:hypothetical protein
MYEEKRREFNSEWWKELNKEKYEIIKTQKKIEEMELN